MSNFEQVIPAEYQPIVREALQYFIDYINQPAFIGEHTDSTYLVPLDDFFGEYGSFDEFQTIELTGSWRSYRQLTFYADYGDDGGGSLHLVIYEQADDQYVPENKLVFATYMFDTYWSVYIQDGELHKVK